MQFLVLGCNHQSATIGMREQLAFSRLVNKLLHPPLESLRLESRSTVPTALLDAFSRLFQLRAYPKTAGDWLILRSLRSKMCLSPSPPRFWDRL